MRIKITLAYEGTAYEGWQAQIAPRQPSTVQSAMQAALFTIAGRQINVIGAGRTDSGVHALGQVCHCDVPLKAWDWRKRLNAVLPPDIRAISVEEASDSFHARKDARSKTYFYNFWLEPAFVPPALRNFVWPCGQLDLEPMQAALPCFAGCHDFASFQNAGNVVKSTERQILDLSLAAKASDLAPQGQTPQLLRFSITGTGFLKQMVRNLAGCLAAVGKGKLAPRAIAQILAARDRRALPSATAPAKGLFLHSVQY